MEIRIDSILFDLKQAIEDLEHEIRKLLKENQKLLWKLRKYEK